MNDYEPNVAAIERSRSVLEQLQKHVEKEPWSARRERLERRLAAGGDYRVKNDLATALAHTGDAAEAVTLLEQIEAEKPGLYMTAANLGTACELAGDDGKALAWIRKGIERNAKADGGTEWLHVRILEAKLALKDDPKWLESHSVLGPRDSSWKVEISVVGNRGETLSTKQVKTALIYQLRERLQFVNPPDAIVGSLLLDLGELLSGELSEVGGAYDVFKLAGNYLDGLPNVEPLQDKAAASERFAVQFGQQSPPEEHPVAEYSFLALAGIALPLLVISLKRRIERRGAGEKTPGAP